MTDTISRHDLARRLSELALGPARRIAAIAGPPGAGKSTLAEALHADIEAALPGRAAVLPMDGYHFDDRVLEARGQRARKGAPFTFDVDGLAAMLERLARDEGREVAVPVFDRSIEIARAGARIVPPETRLILLEGNYLLLDDPDWARLRRFFDVTIMLDEPLATVEARLMARWSGLDGEALRAKMEDNDLPNARLVLGSSVAADYRLEAP